jgi:hypothetical protein
MYAISDSSLLYHLVNGRETYCGAFVTGEKPKSKDMSWLAPLYLVNEKPEDRILCKYCETVKAARERNSTP